MYSTFIVALLCTYVNKETKNCKASVIIMGSRGSIERTPDQQSGGWGGSILSKVPPLV